MSKTGTPHETHQPAFLDPPEHSSWHSAQLSTALASSDFLLTIAFFLGVAWHLMYSLVAGPPQVRYFSSFTNQLLFVHFQIGELAIGAAILLFVALLIIGDLAERDYPYFDVLNDWAARTIFRSNLSRWVMRAICATMFIHALGATFVSYDWLTPQSGPYYFPLRAAFWIYWAIASVGVIISLGDTKTES
jgi:hypothetical protein